VLQASAVNQQRSSVSSWRRATYGQSDHPYVEDDPLRPTSPYDVSKAAGDRVVAERFVPKGSLVVEIRSNDRTLLRAFDRGAVRVLGVEPARNLAAMANAAGIPTLDEFFGEAVAGEISAEHGRATAIIGNNVRCPTSTISTV